MALIDETPDISEEESIDISEYNSFEEDSISIIDSSFVNKDDSNAELLAKKGKKIPIIESDLSNDEELACNVTPKSTRKNNDKRSSAFKPLSDYQQGNNERKSSMLSHQDDSFRNSQRSSDMSAINKTVPDDHRRSVERQSVLSQSYRDVSPAISSRTASPDPDENIIDISSDDEASNEVQVIQSDTAGKSSKTSINENDRFSNMMEPLSNLHLSATKNNLGEVKSTGTDYRENFDNQKNLKDSSNVILLKLQVSDVEYKEQKNKVLTLQANVQKMKNFMRSINMNNLPDKGSALQKKFENLVQEGKLEEDKLKTMVVTKEIKPPPTVLQPVSWENLEAHMDSVQPRTFGKQAMETLNVQKALTLDRLEQLHGSLKTCPGTDTFATDPEGLKVELMPHQKHGIAWLMWREKQKPSGGILADDMGLGKTLTMISLTLKSLQENSDENESWKQKTSKYVGGTLVICPASLLYQWESEIKKHVKKGLLTVYLHHGSARENKAKRLARQNIVITTYGVVSSDNKDPTGQDMKGPLYEVKWRRIILDEAHQIRNHKAQMSVAVCNLSAKSRWALTGTPIHNKELDLYSLLKFLRCTPFDDLAVWKRWVANKSMGGQDRLHTVMSSLILRRTKQQLQEKKALTCLPSKEWKLLDITLEKEEMDVYQKVLIFSRTLFAQFLHQRAEKNSDNMSQLPSLNDPNGEYYKMHQHLVKLNRVKNIKQHEILVLLLRLRQICCHPSLITKMLEGEPGLDAADLEGQEELNLLEQLNKLNLEDPAPATDGNLQLNTDAAVGLAQATRDILNPTHPVFAERRRSTKIKAMMKIINEMPKEDKVIIVSQWSSLLSLISIQLKEEGLPSYQLDGSVNVTKRMEMVDSFNKSSGKVRILLLSLTAGGVGLNLVGANHLILADLHWNPQLEIQAQDRIYRVGQTKPVKIYKIMANDTIECRIKQLQDKKLGLAEELLTGARIQQHSKLSMDDLKMLFNM